MSDENTQEREQAIAKAKQNIRAWLANVELMLAMANVAKASHFSKEEAPTVETKFGILHVLPSGGGRMVSQFEAKPFLEDVALLSGYEKLFDIKELCAVKSFEDKLKEEIEETEEESEE